MIQKKVVFASLAVFIALVVTRLYVLISMPVEVLFNVDELELSLSVIDRFLGLPPTNLAWPATLHQMVGVVAVSAHYILENTQDLGIESFAYYISDLVVNPWFVLETLRISSVFVFSLGFGLLTSEILKYTRSKYLVSLAAIVVLSTPALWLYSSMATGDAFSLGFGAIAVMYALREVNKKNASLLGIALGFGISSKITIVFLFPFLLFLLLRKIGKKTFLILVSLGLAVAVSFGVATPYVWLDPIRLAKSVLGNAGRSGESSGFFGGLIAVSSIIPTWLYFLVILGLIRDIVYRNYATVIGCFLTWFFSALVIGGSGVVYDRYFLPLLIVFFFYSCFGVDFFYSLLWKHVRSPFRVGVLASLFLLLIGGWVLNALKYRETITQKIDAFEEEGESLVVLENCGKDELIAVPYSKLERSLRYWSVDSSKVAVDKLKRRSSYVSIQNFGKNTGLSEPSMVVFGDALTEDEKALRGRLRAASISLSNDGCQVVLYGAKDLVVERFGIISKRELGDLMEKGLIDFIVPD